MTTITMSRDLFMPEGVNLDDEDLQGAIERQATGLQASMNKLREELREIEDDPGLTDEGKRQAREEVAEELRSAIRESAMLDAMQGLREEADQEMERLVNPDHRLQIEDEDRDRALAAEREIREHLRSLRSKENGDLEVQEALRDAAREDRRLMLRAVERDPLESVDPIVGEETLQEVRETHVQTRFPDRARSVEQKRQAAGVLEQNVERADELTRELAGTSVLQEPEGPREVE